MARGCDLGKKKEKKKKVYSGSLAEKIGSVGRQNIVVEVQ